MHDRCSGQHPSFRCEASDLFEIGAVHIELYGESISLSVEVLVQLSLGVDQDRVFIIFGHFLPI